jgi:hypothetical protein
MVLYHFFEFAGNQNLTLHTPLCFAAASCAPIIITKEWVFFKLAGDSGRRGEPVWRGALNTGIQG